MNPRDQNPGRTSLVASLADGSQRNRQRVYASGPWEIDCNRRELRAHGAAVPIGSRAFEIIEVLVQSGGELVTKDDLMARVWSTAIVEDNTLQVHISAIRKALGANRGMLKTVSGRGYRLLGPWAIQRDDIVAGVQAPERGRESQRSFGTNVPEAASALIGREATVQYLRDLLSAYRVVTLTGPGGIGKTVLAAEVARRQFREFAGDVSFVQLVSLSDPSLVPSAVVSVLGLRLAADEISADSVARAIGTKKILLVLDNCEHVINEAASLAETVIRFCPHASILTTSREVLRIEGEYVYQVLGLDVPSDDHATPDVMLGLSAMQLLIARTRALRSDFTPRGENLSALAAICRHLDGIPLAIEFAAARAATLGIREVASRLDDRFALLTGGRRTALPRHQTLRAALDWSYELLPESERCLLRRLAIFNVGFTLEAAAAVMGDDKPIVADSISSLVSKSLLALDGSTTARRWRLLETIRAYAYEKLASSEELLIVSRRRAQHYRERLRRMGQEWKQVHSSGTADLVEVVSNTRAALDWAFSPGGDESIGVALATASVPLWLRLSLLGECRERIEKALDAIERISDLEPEAEMMLRAALGMSLMYTRGPVGEAEAIWARVLELAQLLGNDEYQLRALYGLWLYKFLISEFRVSLELADRFRQVTERGATAGDLPTADRMASITLHFLGDQTAARAYAHRALSAPVLGNRHLRMTQYGTDQRVGPYVFLARALWIQGLPDQAIQKITAGIEEADKVEHANSTCIALADGACLISLLVGNVKAAERFTAMLTDCAEKHALGVWRTYALAVRGRLLIESAPSEGATLLRSALAQLQKTPYDVRFPLYCAWLAETLAKDDRLSEGIAAIDDALLRADRTDERWYFPELLRIKGNLLLRERGQAAAAEVIDLLSQSLRWARSQEALSWELRTAIDLAQFQLGNVSVSGSRVLLRSVYDRFSEGFTTGDLVAAKNLLAELER